jgi:hypothetical protein
LAKEIDIALKNLDEMTEIKERRVDLDQIRLQSIQKAKRSIAAKELVGVSN